MNFFLSTTFIFLVLNRIVHVAYSFSLNYRKSIISSSISALTYFSFSSVVCSFCEFVNLVFFLVLLFVCLFCFVFLISCCNSWWYDKTHGDDINGWPCLSNGTCVYLLEVVSTGLYPLFWILWLISFPLIPGNLPLPWYLGLSRG